MSLGFMQRRFMSSGLQKMAYKWAGFCKYGLWRDDCLDVDFNPCAREALKRVPQDVIDQRNFRILRATQLSIQGIYLPREQWTKLEDDCLYLTPIIKDVEKEKAEMDKWPY